METRRIEKRRLHKGIWVALALFLLTGLSNSSVFASVRDSLLKQSNAVITPPSVVLQNGTTGASTVYTNNTSAMINTAGPSQTLYAHQETTTIGGSTYNLLNLGSSNGAGTDIQVGGGSTGRILFAKFVYSLGGVGSIPSSIWTFQYRAWREWSSAVEVHCDVDISILMANGTTRQIVATDAANSANLPGSCPPTSSGTYSWSTYNVIDQTDFLEIDYYAHVTKPHLGRYVFLRIDDNTLALVDQTSIVNVYLPSIYDYVLKANNTGTDNWQIRLKEYSDSGISRVQNCTIYFHNSTGGSLSQIRVENGTYMTQTGSWYSLGSSMIIYVAIVVQTNNSGTSYINVYMELPVPGTTTYARYIIASAIT